MCNYDCALSPCMIVYIVGHTYKVANRTVRHTTIHIPTLIK